MNATSGVQMDKLARSILAEATGWPREHFWVRQYVATVRLSAKRPSGLTRRWKPIQSGGSHGGDTRGVYGFAAAETDLRPSGHDHAERNATGYARMV